MVSPEGAGILQEHPAVITTGGVNMCPHVMPLSLPTRAGREKASKYLHWLLVASLSSGDHPEQQGDKQSLSPIRGYM